jgi:hypothetical protein
MSLDLQPGVFNVGDVDVDEVVVVKYLLYYDVSNPAAISKDTPPNTGIDAVLARLQDFRPKGQPLEIMDIGKMTEEQRMTAYIRALTPSVYQKYRVRKVFGSQRHAGFAFGRGVPALVVWDDAEGFALDVYPHEKLGRIITIYEFLTKP